MRTQPIRMSAKSRSHGHSRIATRPSATCCRPLSDRGRGWRQPLADEQDHGADRRIGSDDPGGFRACVTDINIGEIAAASTEHSRGIDQMNLTISRPAIPSSLPSASRCAHGLRRAAQFSVPPSECTPRRASRPMRGRLDLGHALLNQPNDEYPKKALHVRTANRVPLIPVRSYRGPIAPRVDGGVRFTPWPHEPSQTIRRRAGEPTRRRIQSHRRSP